MASYYQDQWDNADESLKRYVIEIIMLSAVLGPPNTGNWMTAKMLARARNRPISFIRTLVRLVREAHSMGIPLLSGALISNVRGYRLTSDAAEAARVVRHWAHRSAHTAETARGSVVLIDQETEKVGTQDEKDAVYERNAHIATGYTELMAVNSTH